MASRVELRSASRWTAETGPAPDAARRIVEPFAPVAWAYVSSRTEGVDARATQIRAVTDRLAAASAPPTAIETLRGQLLVTPVGPATVSVFVDAEGFLIHEQSLPGEPAGEDRAGWSSPADVLGSARRRSAASALRLRGP